MRLPEICIKRPVLTSMMNLALLVLGLVALSRLPVRELPDIDPPLVTVTTVYPGASAEIIEVEVTEPLEEVINSVEGIKKITSVSREQVSSVTAEFSLDRDIDLAAQDVRDRVARVRGDLPDDIDEPIIAKQDSDASPMLWVAMFSDKYDTRALSEIADQILKDPLETIDGVSSVILGGEKRFAIRIRLDAQKMAAHEVTVIDIQRALREQNIELPSGRVENFERELIIQTLGELKTPEEFNRLVIREEDGTFIRLQDVGSAEIGVEDERAIARYLSKPAVGLGVVRQAKANIIEVADGVYEVMEEYGPRIPEGVELFIGYDESIFVRDSIEQVWTTLFVAFLLVVITIFVFLRNVRSTLIPALTIPIATLSTFAVLSFMGYSVNILTMLGLVLAIGIVVDDSIVVLENIYRHIEEGMSAMDAAFQGMKEIVFAVIATTASLLAVFIPLVFQSTITGRLFIEFAVALCGAVVVSSFIALTLTPMVCARILKFSPRTEQNKYFAKFEDFLSRLTTNYLGILDSCFRYPKRIMLLGTYCVLLAVSFLLGLEQEFLPTEDKSRLFSLAIAPEGSTAEYTDRMARKMEEIISSVPEVIGYFTAVALPFDGAAEANKAFMFTRLKKDRDRGLKDILAGPNGVSARYWNEIPGAFAFAIMPKAVDTGFGQEFQLVLQSNDLGKLADTSDEVVNKLQQSGLLANVRSEFQFNKGELEVNIDRDRAAALNVSIEDLARTLQILFGGEDLSTVKAAGEEYEVIVQFDREARLTPDDLRNIYVRSRNGRLIQIDNIVSLKTVAGPNAVYRYNRFRSATIEGTPQGVVLGTVLERVSELLDKELPEGVTYTFAGEAEDLQDANQDFLFVLFLALVFIYMVLASQFESIVHPVTVMLAVPLAALGGLGGLWLLSVIGGFGEGMYACANYSPEPPVLCEALNAIVPRIPAMNLNIYSIIGLVLLFGLATKTSILLVDFAKQYREQGLNAVEAMREAARTRFRPILMTAFSTIIGLMPIVIGFGAGAESRRPMGVAVVGGMLVSTFLTLFIVPVVYVFLDGLVEKYFRKREENS